MATTTYGTPYVSGTDLVANWPAASLTVANSIDAAGYFVGRGINAQTASYTTVLTDAGKTVSMTNAGATTLTIPANSSVAYVVGTRINILNLGVGACTPTAGAGVTISGTISALVTNASASVIKTATNTWSYISDGGTGGGKILQVVQATTTTGTSSSSSTYANTALTATITPSLVSSKVLILVSHGGAYKTTSNTYLKLRLTRDGTAITGDFAGDANFTGGAGSLATQVGTNYLDSPAATTALVYRTQLQSGANTADVTVSNGASLSTMILMEVGA